MPGYPPNDGALRQNRAKGFPVWTDLVCPPYPQGDRDRRRQWGAVSLPRHYRRWTGLYVRSMSFLLM